MRKRSLEGRSGLFLLISACFLLSIVCPPAVAETGDQKEGILVIGTGTIRENNVARAKDEALSEALIRGVEDYLVDHLGGQGAKSNFSRIVREIVPRAKEQVENYHILAEERIDGLYKLLVRVKVNRSVMEETFREVGLHVEVPSIRVLFLVSQSTGRQTTYWWGEPENVTSLTPIELTLFRVFQEHGLQPVNRLSNMPEGHYSEEMKAPDLSEDMAVNLGKVFSADVVVQGRCEIDSPGAVTIFLKALGVSTGSILGQDEISETAEASPGKTNQEALEAAVKKLAAGLCPEIIRAYGDQEIEIRRIQVTLRGLKSFRQLREFEDFLIKKVPGVRSVVQTRVKGRSISFAVEFTGGESTLLARLDTGRGLPFQASLKRSESGGLLLEIR